MNSRKYYKTKIKENRKTIILLSFFSVLASLFSVTFAYISKFLIDNFNNKNKIIIYSIILFSICLIEILIEIIKTHYSFKKTLKLEIEIKEDLFDSLLYKDFKKIKDNSDSDILSTITNDSKIIANGIISFIPRVVTLISSIISSLIFLYFIDYIFASILLLSGIIIFFISKPLRKKNKALSKIVQQDEANLLSFYNESITNLLILKVFNNKNKNKKREQTSNNNLYNSRLNRANFNIKVSGMFSFLSRLAYLITILYAVIMLYNKPGFLSAGSLIAIIQLVAKIEGPFMNLSGILPSYYQTLASIDRLENINQIENDHKETLNEFNYLEGIDVSFSYNQKEVIHNLSFKINKGDFVIIKGESGSGKTTLIKLIMGLYKTSSGSIKFNGDIDSYTIKDIYSYVPQNNFIFNGTIEENLLIFSDINNKTIINNTLDIVGLSKYKNELDTLVFDLNKGLSEGELQRLSVARALLSNKEILVLDEATSALDLTNEINLLNNLKTLNKTIIFITHKEFNEVFSNNIIEVK